MLQWVFNFEKANVFGPKFASRSLMIFRLKEPELRRFWPRFIESVKLFLFAADSQN